MENCTTSGVQMIFFFSFTIKVAFVTLVNTDVFGDARTPLIFRQGLLLFVFML